MALWIEFKAHGGRLRKGQPEWHERERLRGGLVWTVDSLESFEASYAQQFGWLRAAGSRLQKRG